MTTYLFVGDSITCTDRFETADMLGHGFVKMLSEQLYNKPGDIVINKGYDGYTARQLVRLLPSFLGLHADVVNILVGINDVCEYLYAGGPDAGGYQRSVRSMVEAFQAQGAAVILMEPFLFPYPSEYQRWFPALDQFRAALRQLADETGCTLIPLWDIFQEKLSVYSADQLTLDGIHPTKLGHQIIAAVRPSDRTCSKCLS